MRRGRGPANLLQGLRDYFGAHTYRRLDKPGKFHTRWSQDGSEVDGRRRARLKRFGREPRAKPMRKVCGMLNSGFETRLG